MSQSVVHRLPTRAHHYPEQTEPRIFCREFRRLLRVIISYIAITIKWKWKMSEKACAIHRIFKLSSAKTGNFLMPNLVFLACKKSGDLICFSIILQIRKRATTKENCVMIQHFVKFNSPKKEKLSHALFGIPEGKLWQEKRNQITTFYQMARYIH